MAVSGWSTSNFYFRSVSNDYNLPGTALTIHGWGYRGSTGANEVVIGRWGSSNAVREYLIQITSGDKLLAAVNDGVGSDIATGATSIGSGSWKAYALRKNGTGAGALQVWLNGTQDGSATSNKSIQNLGSDTGSQFRFGIDGNSGFPYSGRLAEFGIWDVALSDAELVALSKGASPLTIRPNHLKGYFPLWGDVATQPQLGGSNGNVQRNGTLSTADHPPVSVYPPRIILPGVPIFSAVAAVTGAAALTGTGSLAATGSHTAFAAGALTGAGSATVAGVRTRLGAATLTGAGSLASAGFQTAAGTVSITGLGSLTANGFQTAAGAADLAGTGSLSATGGFIFTGSAALSALGSSTAAGVVIRYGIPALTGAGSLTASGTVSNPPHVIEGDIKAGFIDRPLPGQIGGVTEGRIARGTRGGIS